MTWPVIARDLRQYLGTVLAANYRIERELGVGATARVYLAHDLKHDRLVALKVLRPEIAVAMGAERFLREIQTAARLSHPGILPLYDSGETDGLLYFTMPFVEGESLRDRMERDEQLPVNEAVALTRDIAEALGHAHAQGVIHRDVKPENILLANGRPLVADFGIALALEESAERLTHTGMVVGTPRYMSPEQSMGTAGVDQRTDIYSLGCVLYELLAGRAPIEGPSLQAIVTKRRFEEPPRIETLRPGVPRAVSTALAEALAKDPDDRFRSMAEFSAALVGPPRRRRMSRRMRRRLRGGIAIGAALAAVGAVAFANLQSRPGGKLRERDWVVVADFDGPPSDPSLGRVVRELVTTELNQSRFVSTMPRSLLTGALRASGYADTTTVNVDVAREIAERSAVRAVVAGRVSTTNGGYQLAVSVVDRATRQVLASDSAVATPDSVVPVVQRVARRVREELGERRQDLEANQLLLDIATPSLPAYRKYVDALARKEGGDVAGSTRLLREAIALDTGFAAAWALMGTNYIEVPNLDSARLALREALRRPTRMNALQLYRLRGDAAYAVDHDVPAAVRWYDAYLSQTPSSMGGFNNRGLFLSMLGRYEDALRDFETGEGNSPFGPDQAQPMIINATDMLVALGQVGRAQAKARGLTSAYAQYAAMRLASVSDRWAAADTVATRALAVPGVSPGLRLEATTMHAAATASRGAIADADGALVAAAALASGEQRRWYEQARSLLALATESAAPPLSAPVAGDTASGALVVRGVRLALRGDTSEARAAARRIKALPPTERARFGYGAETIDALVDAHAGRWARVVETLGPAARAGEHNAKELDRVPSVMLRWIVADAYGHLGQLDSAVATLQRGVGYERVPPGHLSLRGFVLPYAERRLARWYAARGDTDASRRAWAAFNALLTTPDPSLRRLREPPPAASPPAPNRARSPHAG